MPVLELTKGDKYVAARLDYDLLGTLILTVLTGQACRVKAMNRSIVADIESGYALLDTVRLDAQSTGYQQVRWTNEF